MTCTGRSMGGGNRIGAEERDQTLQQLLAPRSIVIVGASADFLKVGGRPLKNLLEKGYKGSLHLVNPKYESIAGIPCCPRIADIPQGVELAIVAVPAREVAGAIRQLGEKGVRGAVVFSSGFAETGEAGRALEEQLGQAAREAGIRLCGPNGLGFVNAFDNVVATFSQYADGETPAGPVGFVSQSGAFGTAIAALARARNLGLGYFVNTGNETDVDLVQVMRQLITDPRIKVGAAYVEGIKNGPAFLDLAEQAMAAAKPLIVTKVGRMKAGARAVASHTGALAGDDAVFNGIARQVGVIRARNEEHMLDIVEVLSNCELPKGKGLGLLTQSGGAGVLMADRAEELGLQVPQLQPATREALHTVIPGFGAVGNPVDVTGQFLSDPELLRKSTAILLTDPAIDVGVIWFQLMHSQADKLVRVLQQIKSEATKPIVVCWVAGPPDGMAALRASGIPVLRGAEPAIDAVAALCQYAESRRRWQEARGERQPPPALPDVPAASGPVATVEAARLLAGAGLSLSAVALADSAEQAVAEAERLGYPVAVKIESPDILHKTDADGVRLGLADAQAVRRAFEAVTASARKHRPDARIDGVVVQAMAGGDTEFVLGLQYDRIFGPVVMAGLGGVLIEVLKDVAFRRAPLAASEAEDMLRELRGSAILEGVRGRPPVDRAALISAICAVSRLGAALGPRLHTLDINPLLLSHDRVIAVDWLMLLNNDRAAAA